MNAEPDVSVLFSDRSKYDVGG